MTTATTTGTITITGATLGAMLKQCDRAGGKYVLDSLALTPCGVLWTTDGRRLATVRPTEQDLPGTADGSALLSLADLKNLSKAASRSYHISREGDAIRVTSFDTRKGLTKDESAANVVVRATAPASLPPVFDVIPKIDDTPTDSNFIGMQPDYLTQAMQLAKTVTDEHSPAVRLQMKAHNKPLRYDAGSDRTDLRVTGVIMPVNMV